MTKYIEQIDGDHYQATTQHWDVMEACDISYLEDIATKHIDRWRSKGEPLLDLEKARTYLLKMDGRGVMRHADPELLDEWLRARDHHEDDAEMLRAILSPERGRPGDVRMVIAELEVLIEQHKSDA